MKLNETAKAWIIAAIIVIIFIASLRVLANNPDATWPFFVIIVGVLIIIIFALGGRG